MSKPFSLPCFVLLAVVFGAVGAPSHALDAADPQAVDEVLRGVRAVANAAWWGFDEEDATPALQAAIDSGARKVVVPYMGTPWHVTPITLRSELELVFEPGVVVLAKKGAFRGKGDSLFRAMDCHDITLSGYGAVLRMRKEDYQKEPYEKAEWRMCTSFRGCRKVRIEGLRLEKSGGDGIYIGATSALPYCVDVVIRDVVCDGNHRQGASIISAVDLLIENCQFLNTDGTAPRAGVDFEPNAANEKLINCVMRGCVIDNNAGPGILVYLKPLTAETDPVSVRCEDCYIRGGRHAGLVVGAVRDDGPRGTIEFRDCTVENVRLEGAVVYDKSAAGARVRFVNCNWRGVWSESPAEGRVPLTVRLGRPSITTQPGGVEFVDCRLWDSVDRPAILYKDESGEYPVRDVRGTIIRTGPGAARSGGGLDGSGLTLTDR